MKKVKLENIEIISSGYLKQNIFNCKYPEKLFENQQFKQFYRKVKDEQQHIDLYYNDLALKLQSFLI